jgi:hypothetical protein
MLQSRHQLRYHPRSRHRSELTLLESNRFLSLSLFSSIRQFTLRSVAKSKYPIQRTQSNPGDLRKQERGAGAKGTRRYAGRRGRPGQALVPAALQQIQELDEGIGHGTAAARGGGGRRECAGSGAAGAGSRDGAGVLAAGLRRPPQLFPRLQVSRRPLLASSLPLPLSQAGCARWNASMPP